MGAKRRKRFWIVAGAAMLIGAALWIGGAATSIFDRFRLSFDHGVASEVEALLRSKLGSNASLGAVNLSWTGVRVYDIELPLDDRGSLLKMSSAEIGWSVRAFLRHPLEYGLVAKSLTVHEPELIIRVGSGGSEPMTGRWLKNVRLPDTIFSFFSRLDSLSSVEIVDGQFALRDDSSVVPLLRRFDGRIVRDESENYDMVITGYYGESERERMSVSSRMDCLNRDFDLEATLSIPPGILPFDSVLQTGVITSGGRVKFRGWQSRDSTGLFGDIALDSARYRLGHFDIIAPKLIVTLAHDTLRATNVGMVNELANAQLSGQFALVDDGPFMLRAAMSAGDSLMTFAAARGIGFSPDDFNASVSLSGTLSEFSGRYDFSCDSINTALTTIEQIGATGTFDSHELAVDNMHWQLPSGSGYARGNIDFEDSALTFQGELDFDSLLDISGRDTRISGLAVAFSGTLSSATARVSLKDSTDAVFLQARLWEQSEQWNAEIFNPADSLIATATYRQPAREVNLHTSTANELISALFDQTPSFLTSIRTLDIQHQGDASGGVVQVGITTAADSTGILPLIAREFNFSGDYRMSKDGQMLRGQWQGIGGDGVAFTGSAEGILRDRRFDLQHCFIDEVGQIEGFVDLTNDTLHFRTEIKDLPYEKFPLKPEFLQRAKLAGTIAGHAEISGSLQEPRWNAAFTLVDGSILAIPGYWLNTEAHGTFRDVYLDRLELGRDVSKIFDVTGWADFERQLISLNAVATEARAEDFVAALVGREKLLSGAIAGSIKVSGNLSAPSIAMELSATRGELFDQIWFDTLATKVELDIDSIRGQALRIPDFYLAKSRTYEFNGDLTSELRSSGKFSAHIDGRGDFIDLVDQVDRTFIGYGSEGSLTMDFGGTSAAPKFLGADLTVRNGRFSYVDATPGLTGVDIHISVGAPGQVDSGAIHLTTGESMINVDFVPEAEARDIYGLEPLIIPRPRLNLGVLVIRTGADGVPVTLPGFMKKDWSGIITTGSKSQAPLTISAYGDSRLKIQAAIDLRDSRITFPFLPMGAGVMRPVARWLYKRLIEAQWAVDLTVGTGNHYDVELTNLKDSDIFAPLRGSPVLSTIADYFDHLTIDALVEPSTDTLRLSGVIDSSTFFMNGNLTTRRGRVDYLDQTFQIDYAFSDFDGTDIMPVLEGRAYTFGVDSVGRRVPVYLTMYQVDSQDQSRSTRGRLDKIVFVLEGAGGENSEKALEYLGYKSAEVSGKAEQLVATTALRVIGRQWIDPLERKLERWTWLDEITLSPGGGKRTSLSRQYLQSTIQADSLAESGVVRYFAGSQLSVGKYLTDEVFLSYTGELAETQSGIESGRIGLVHFWNLEYRMEPISRDLVLDFAVEYDEAERRRDESVSLKYSFVLEP